MFIKILLRACLLVAMFVLWSPAKALSEEEIPTPNTQYVAPGHHEFHGWYQEIQSQLKLGDSCCDEKSQDCGPVTEYKIASNGIISIMLEDKKWHDVVGDGVKIFYVDTPDERAHACRQPLKDQYGNVYAGEFVFYCVFIPMRGV